MAETTLAVLFPRSNAGRNEVDADLRWRLCAGRSATQRQYPQAGHARSAAAAPVRPASSTNRAIGARPRGVIEPRGESLTPGHPDYAASSRPKTSGGWYDTGDPSATPTEEGHVVAGVAASDVNIMAGAIFYPTDT